MHKNNSKLALFSILTSVAITALALDNSIYIKYQKIAGKYQIESVEATFINQPNVLQFPLNLQNCAIESPIIPDYYHRVSADDQRRCSAAYTNTLNLPYCEGDFVNSGSVIINTTANAIDALLSVGALTSISGGEYTTQANPSTINQALQDTQIENNPKVQKLVTQCQIAQKNRADLLMLSESTLATEQWQINQATNRWESNLIIFRKTLKAGDKTNCGTASKTSPTQALVITNGITPQSVWISRDNLYPEHDVFGLPIQDCKESGVYYKHFGRWVESQS